MLNPSPAAPPLPLARSEGTGPAAGAIVWPLVELTKPRLATLSVLTTMAAYAAARPVWDGTETTALLAGTMLSAAGALALNQWRERETDAMMERTRNRPLPSGAIPPGLALGWSASLAGAGLFVLAAGTNLLAAAISALTIALYVAVYTPLKRRTRWATEAGAVPGALPPLIGFAAADGSIGPFGWMIFALLALWQMPHFFAIGWICRRDYAEAGFPLLPAIDPGGIATARWSVGYSAGLLFVSILPWIFGYAGPLFGVTALLGGAGMLWFAVRFMLAPAERDVAARRLFRASILYLPAVLVALVVDRCAL